MMVKTEYPEKEKYYWFAGMVYHEDDMQGYVKVRGLAYVHGDIIIVDGTGYPEQGVVGEFFGPLPDPPWKFET